MANPYAAGASAGTIMANVKGDIGNNNDNPQGRLDETGLTTAEVTRRLLAYTRPYRLSLIASFVASAVSVVLQLYVPIVIGRAIDCMVSAGDVDFATLVALLQELALVVVGAAVTQWLSGYCTNRLTYETVRDLRIDAFSRFRDLPLSFVDAHSHGDLLSRVVNDADQVGDGLLQGLTQLFTGVVTIVGTLVFMFSISVPVGLVVVIVTPVSMLVAWLIARYSAKSFKEQQALQGSLGGYVEEMVGSQKLVCAFAYGDRAQAGFDEINQRLLGVGEHAQFTSSLSNPATRVVNNITYAVVAVVGCICVISGWPSVLTVGQVQTFLSYANQYMKPFNEISNVVTQIQTAYASARRLFTLIDAPAQSADPAEPEVDENPEGALEFSHVDFSYVPDRPLLQDISFVAKPGQTIAWLAPQDAARRPLSTCCCASMTWTRSDHWLTATTPATCAERTFARSLAWCFRTPGSSGARFARTLPTERPGQRWTTLWRPPRRHTRTSSSSSCRRATTRSWARTAGPSPQASGSSSALRVRACRPAISFCSTRQQAPSTRAPSCRCRTPSIA